MQGKRIAILGGSSGIGLALARRLAPGNDVHVISRAPERAGVGTPHAADLADPAAIARACGTIGPVDHLVYTAGGPLALAPMPTLDLAAAREFFTVRYFGALAAVKHAQVRESIALTGGTAGTRPAAGWAVGASLCGAMEALTRALAVELAPVRVNIVVPGYVDTPLWGEHRAGIAAAGARLLVGRVGTADEVAAAYEAMLANPYITGQRLVVDGGGVLT